MDIIWRKYRKKIGIRKSLKEIGRKCGNGHYFTCNNPFPSVFESSKKSKIKTVKK